MLKSHFSMSVEYRILKMSPEIDGVFMTLFETDSVEDSGEYSSLRGYMHSQICAPTHTDHCLYLFLVVYSLKGVSEICLVKDVKAGLALKITIEYFSGIYKNIIPENVSKGWALDK